MASKQDVANLLHSLPGADNWYGKDKINQWASGNIGSVTYDKYLSWLNLGHKDWVIADVQKHTNQPDPLDGWKNTQVYAPVVAFLKRQLSNQQTELNNLRNSLSPDNNPVAIQTIFDEIARTQAALTYYLRLSAR